MLSSHDSVHLLGEAMMYHIKMVSILISFIVRPKHRLLSSSDLKTEHTADSVALAQWFCCIWGLKLSFFKLSSLTPTLDILITYKRRGSPLLLEKNEVPLILLISNSSWHLIIRIALYLTSIFYINKVARVVVHTCNSRAWELKQEPAILRPVRIMRDLICENKWCKRQQTRRR